MKKIVSGVPVILVLISILVSSPAEKAFAKTKILKIGTVTTLSGPAAPWGMPATRLMDMTIEKINSAGGLKIGGKVYKLKGIYYDQKTSVAEATAYANRIVYQDQVKYIITGIITPCILAIQTVTEPNGVFYAHMCFSRDSLGPDKPYSFRCCVSDLEVARMSWDWIVKTHPNVKTVAIINPNDSGGWTTRDSVMAAAQRHGIKIVASELFERGAVTDFTPLLTRILAKKPDVLNVGVSAPGDVGLICKQAHALGFRGLKEITAMGEFRTALKIAGPEACEGLFSAFGSEPDSPAYPKAFRELAAAYKAKYGETMGGSGRDSTIVLEMLIDAWQKAGTTDVDATIAQIEKQRQFETCYGPVVLGGREDHGVDRQLYYYQYIHMVKDGKVVVSDKTWPGPPSTYPRAPLQ
jgi:branched-chain amino acid transport system substrate-binding protein